MRRDIATVLVGAASSSPLKAQKFTTLVSGYSVIVTRVVSAPMKIKLLREMLVSLTRNKFSKQRDLNRNCCAGINEAPLKIYWTYRDADGIGSDLHAHHKAYVYSASGNSTTSVHENIAGFLG
jgi:hypothetical protein